MSRPPASPDARSSEPQLDERVCAEVGALLAAARAARNLPLPEVADRLLLSTRQVRALEQLEAGAFYNAAFFVTALRKYALLVGVESDLLDRALASSAPAVQAAPAAVPVAAASAPAVIPGAPGPVPNRPRAVADAREAPPVPPLVVGAGVVLILAVALGAWTLWPRGVSSPPAAPPRAATPPPPAAAVTPAPAPAASPAPDDRALDAPAPTVPPPEPTPEPRAAAAIGVDPSGAYGRVRVRRTTWVYLRYVNGAVVERMLLDGEELVMQSQPAYVAVGIPDGVELSLGDRPVDVSRFVVNGQVRIRSADLAALAAGR